MLKFSKGSLTVSQMASIDSIERKHNLPKNEHNHVSPTIEFLKAVATELSHWGKVSLSEAWQVWIAIHQYRSERQKQESESAELAFWYGINPYGLTEQRRAGLVLNLPRVKAQQQLESGNFDALNYEAVYDLTKLATGDEEQALAARAESLKLLIAHKAKRGNA